MSNIRKIAFWQPSQGALREARRDTPRAETAVPSNFKALAYFSSVRVPWSTLRPRDTQGAAVIEKTQRILDVIGVIYFLTPLSPN